MPRGNQTVGLLHIQCEVAVVTRRLVDYYGHQGAAVVLSVNTHIARTLPGPGVKHVLGQSLRQYCGLDTGLDLNASQKGMYV